MTIKKGDIVEFRNEEGISFGIVEFISTTQDGEVISYYVVPRNGEDNVWVSPEDILSFCGPF
jgi:hypothetical protein